MNHDLTVIYCTIVEDLHVSIKHSSHMEYFNVAFLSFFGGILTDVRKNCVKVPPKK